MPVYGSGLGAAVRVELPAWVLFCCSVVHQHLDLKANARKDAQESSDERDV